MNTPSHQGCTKGCPGARAGRPAKGAFGAALAAATALALLCLWTPAQAAQSFVEPYPGVQVVDSAVDNLGITYVLGKDANNNTVIKKYSAAGATLLWTGDQAEWRTNSDLIPTAFCVAPGPGGTTNILYVVGKNGAGNFRITSLFSDSGTVISNLVDGPTFYPNSITLSGGSLYVCGNYTSSGTSSILGQTANPRGSQAACLIKMDPNLPQTGAALKLITFGGGTDGNTAESVAVDEGGEVFMAGHFAPGVFTLDGTLNPGGQWQVEVVYASTGIGSISTATNILAGNNVVKRVKGSYSTINFAQGNGTGNFGADIGFPGGGGNYFVLHAVGTIWVPTAGSYTFRSSTDDGTQVMIDGTNHVFSYDSTRSMGNSDSTFTLAAGLHSVDYIMYNNEGDAGAEFAFQPPGASDFSLVTPTPLNDTQNKGYVAKWDPTLSILEQAYSSASGSAGNGGTYHELHYSQGWVYAAGSWRGTANNPAIGLPDDSSNASLDIDIVKLDTSLTLKGRATVKGAADNEAYSITSDEAGNAYVVGSYGPASVDFVGNGDRNTTDATQDRKFTSLSAPGTSRFVAKLDSNMNYQWVDYPIGALPDSFLQVDKVRWNSVLQRVFWVGYFVGGSGSLTLGQPTSAITMTGSKGFLAVLDPDGNFTEQVYLTVVSDFGLSGVQVLPWGGPLSGGNPTLLNRRSLIKGVQVTASVPQQIFRQGTNDVADEDHADTRIHATGYSVNNNVPTGGATSYTFVITDDTAVQFNWAVDYALSVDSDLTGTGGEGDIANGIPKIPGLISPASGNPDPPVQKHWIAANDNVIAKIDSGVVDLTTFPGLPVKYQVTGYDAFGPANTITTNGTTNFIAFTTDELRQQIPPQPFTGFPMSGPALIRYHWKLKIGVQMNTTGISSTGYPYVHVTHDGGTTNVTVSQQDGVGSGTFFYDYHSSVEIGSLKNQGVVALKGWLNGDGTIFANSGDVTNLTDSFTINGTNYASMAVGNLMAPARVMWNYGDRIFEETVFIGNSVTFSTVDDTNVYAILRRDLAPERAEVLDGPASSTSLDMAIWDPAGKKYYPLRPGTVLSYWYTSSPDPAARVIIRLNFKYPVAPHYRHIANTPGVNLEPATNDLVSFNSLKYTEATTGAAVDHNNLFTATGPGKTVLLFNQTSSAGRGGAITTLRVRVVQSSLWDSQLPAIQTALIGQKITSAYDTAGLGTGYTMFTNARYNPFIYNPQAVTGPIIPVNLNPTEGPNEHLVVAWYENRDKILWPYQAVRYQPAWPTSDTGLNRIVIASRYGSESVAYSGTNQIVTPEEYIGTNYIPAETTFNPIRFQNMQIYNQPDRTIAGYNPNEEHALMAPSLRSAAVSPQPMAAYALRDGDLNVTSQDANYTSDPYVLVQFLDSLHDEFKMKVYNIVRATNNPNAGTLSYDYEFNQAMFAGEPVIPFYPLVQVIGATPCDGTYGRDGQPAVQKCFWKDHKGTGWAISGNSFFDMYFYYPLTPDFWWPAADQKNPGDCVAFLPDQAGFPDTHFAINYNLPNQTPPAQKIHYTTTWPQDLPILKVGETLTFPGGEYSLDNPTTSVVTDTGDVQIKDTPGLPGVVGWAAGQVIYDSLNPTNSDKNIFTNYTVILYQALEQRTVSLPISSFPDILLPANKRTEVKNGNYVFLQAPSSLQKRVFYNPITGELGIKGFLNDKDIGNPTLTASPPAVYALEPNVMTEAEKNYLNGSTPGSPFFDIAGSAFAQAVNALYDLCRNPNQLAQNGGAQADQAYRLGLEQEIIRDSSGQPLLQTNSGIVTPQRDRTKGSALVGLGPGLAVVANPAMLRTNNTVSVSYVTMAENNSDALGGAPVVLHIIKVDRTQRYRGSIKTILSDNVFDENIVLRHTADFGGNADELVFEWWYRPEDGTTADTPDRATSPNPWKLFADPSGKQGLGFYQLTLKGNPSAPEALIADSLFFLRYRHKDELVDGVNWEIPQTNQVLGGEEHCVLNVCVPGIPYDWAGAGNSSPKDLDGDGKPDYLPQLVEGWIKRVIDRVNVYEARINDFTADNPATYSSMIRELGARYMGPVALNPDKNVIENVGLIELYQTILDRGKSLSIDLSTPVSTPSIANALELASTRLSDFYQLLGNEAYSDALNPTIGFGSDSVEYGYLAPTVFAFQNQVSSLLEEELALLRGQDAYFGPPVYNRLFWNFNHAEGEAAYVMNYDIKDVNKDGFIDVNDAMILYPQGHGDAWGHYLTALTQQYDLLRHPFFNWVSRSEFINLQDIVVPVDYLDERKFAQAAAAKAQAGSEIVNMTYRQKYVANPNGQWQGYTDTDPVRAWGVDEWAHRAGQGAYFDWVTANALLPAVHPNTNYTGIQKIDRTTVQDVPVVAENLNTIQTTIDQVDNGNNPLGVARSALTFDIDPTFLQVGSTAQIGVRAVQGLQHFDQIFERAVQALINALSAFDNANQLNNMIRQIADSTDAFQNEVFQEDLSYRNQLIEIFGSPYEGTIGSGQAYPPGYVGPDTMLYMYVRVNTINDSTVPQAPVWYVTNYLREVTGGNAHFLTAPQGDIPGFNNDWVSRYNLTFQNASSATQSVNFSDFSDPTNQPVNSWVDSNVQTNLNLPILAKGYTFVAPAEWGSRASPGELQQIISQMVQAQVDLNDAIYKWSLAGEQFIIDLQRINAKYDLYKQITLLTQGEVSFDSLMGALSLGFTVLSKFTDVTYKAAAIPERTGKEAVPTDGPIFGLADGPGDVLSILRAGFLAVDAGLNDTFDLAQVVLESLAGGTDLAKSIGDAIFALKKQNAEQNFDLIQDLQDLNFNSSNESSSRMDVFKAVQVLNELSDQYRAKLAEGNRLLQQREAFNKRVAAQAQQNRYQDMTFRVARNAALEKYRSAFDLAARYAYLTATAYDFDLNLAWDDPGSPVDILTDIVRQRTLGLVNQLNGQVLPLVGAGGLSEDLAILRANYDNLKSRMGLNNYSQESLTFSLRSEAFRVDPSTNGDSNWRQFLNSANIYQQDLWQVPEFRRYCRPFTSITNGPQPGLVIPFSSEIISGKNFFGHPLGGGDNAYDPSVYANKIDSVTVWFPFYDLVNLPQTPRVYLIPAGSDILTIPNDPNLGVRIWNVLDTVIPIPFPSISSHLSEPDFKPLTDSLSGQMGQTKQFSSFLGQGFDHDQLSVDEQNGLVYSARLVGRSTWNTKWLLIIPGATLNADPNTGLANLINSITDIRLVINSYGYSGN
jgi:hypothetical protein